MSYLAVEKGRSARSLSAYRSDLAAYAAFLHARGLDLRHNSPAVVEEYLEHLRVAGRQPATRARALVAIRGLHRFCEDERGAPVDPTCDLERPKVPAGLPKALSEAEVQALLAAPRGEDPKALRDRAVLEVLYATGVRISELAGMNLGDLDLPSALVRVLGKGDKERIVPVGRFALAAVTAWLSAAGRPALIGARRQSRDDADALFCSTRARRMSRQALWSVVREAAAACGLAERVTPHVLRHSFATHLLDHGADVRVVQELLGHASIQTTQVYTKVSQAHLRRVYLAAHPRARQSAASPR